MFKKRQHTKSRSLYLFIFVLYAAISLSGCGDDSDSSPNSTSLLKPYEKNGQVPNFYVEFSKNEEMMRNWNVFKSYIMNDSTLSARDTELIFLRAGWLTQSDYLFKLHMEDARTAGLSDSDIQNIQIDDTSSVSWGDSDLAILNGVDEIFLDTFIGDDTWNSLESIYTVEQLIDFLLIAGDAFLEAFAIKSMNIPPDDENDIFSFETLSTLNNKVVYTGDTLRTRLNTPRIPILEESEWSTSLAELLEPYRVYGSVLNIFTTLAHNELAFKNWGGDFAAYVLDSSLPGREREFLLLRIGWLCYSEYEFSQHALLGKMTCGLASFGMSKISATLSSSKAPTQLAPNPSACAVNSMFSAAAAQFWTEYNLFPLTP